MADFYRSPPLYPGRPWTRHGQKVSSYEIEASAGPEHCDWQSVTFLTIGWPLGSLAYHSDQAREYLRDPEGKVTGHPVRLDASLPSDAVATGFRDGPVELYLSRSDQDRFAYLVLGASVERWPRQDPMAGCV